MNMLTEIILDLLKKGITVRFVTKKRSGGSHDYIELDNGVYQSEHIFNEDMLRDEAKLIRIFNAAENQLK